MTGSIRARLTTWYVGVLAVATLSLTGASWWLSGQSVVGAADISLEARVEGVRAFLENPRTRLTVEGLRDEFGEYAELTRGEAVLEVIDASGVVLVRPAIRGWADMDVQPVDESAGAPIQPVDRVLDGLPFRVAAARMDVAGRQFRVTVGAPMGPAYAALNRFHRLLLLALPLVLVFAGAGGYWISRRALAPVDRITREMQAITVERLDRRVEVPAGDDEVSRLASTVNVVLARLQAAVGDIVRFTADASHELRTPVSLVRTTAELALRREREPEAYRAALVDVLGHARRMSVLVEDLLVLARTDAGLEPGGGAIADLADIARSACDDASAVAAARAVALRVGPLAGPVRVRGEAALIRRLLTILVDNAVKYSPAGSVVDVEVGRVESAGTGPDQAVLHVRDQGIGVDEAEVPRLFERFYRGARARRHDPEGSGLGLAIAHAIVERCDGGLTVSPAGGPQGRAGCLVEVRLPLAGAGGAA